MDDKKAERQAEVFAERQLKDYALWSKRPAFDELRDRLQGAFIMGYRAGQLDAKSPKKKEANE